MPECFWFHGVHTIYINSPHLNSAVDCSMWGDHCNSLFIDVTSFVTWVQISWPKFTRPKPKAVLQISSNYFKRRLLFCMRVKIRTNLRHKSEHSINYVLVNIKFSSFTRGSSSHLASRIPIGLARLLPLCRLSWSDVGDSNIMVNFSNVTSRPNPWMDPTMYISGLPKKCWRDDENRWVRIWSTKRLTRGWG